MIAKCSTTQKYPQKKKPTSVQEPTARFHSGERAD